MPFAMITGGASLMGEGIAQSLVARGWQVALTDIDIPTMTGVAKRLGNGVVAAEPLDVTDLGAVKTCVASLAARHGAIAGLVTLAGGNSRIGVPAVPFAETRPEHWDKSINVNLKGVLNCCHVVLPLMKEARKGSVVAMSAARGLRGGPNAALYSATKAGIILFVQAVSSEVAPFGVRINSIVPGSAEARWREADGRPALDHSPLGRPTNQRDIGEGVAFLMSDEASHITGSCLDVSGGTALH